MATAVSKLTIKIIDVMVINRNFGKAKIYRQLLTRYLKVNVLAM